MQSVVEDSSADDWTVWPVVWRIMLAEKDGSFSALDEYTSMDAARSRLAELREFGWPVHLERVSVEPLR